MLVALVALGRYRGRGDYHHSDVVRQKLLGLVQQPLLNRTYGRAARVLSNSAAYASGSKLLTDYASKVTVLPMGIDLGPYQSPSRRQ